jgi:hypothetical protein
LNTKFGLTSSVVREAKEMGFSVLPKTKEKVAVNIQFPGEVIP